MIQVLKIDFHLPEVAFVTEEVVLSFPLMRFALRFRADAAFWAVGYRGSAWRGVFGHALKRLVCIWREGDCKRCLVAKNCVYPYVFETPMVRTNEQREELSPHPFVLDVDGDWGRRQLVEETVGVTLFGEGCRNWPYVLQALREGGAMGIGREKIRMELCEICQEDTPGSGRWVSVWDETSGMTVMEGKLPLPPTATTLFRIRLETPLRLRLQQRMVTASELQPAQFLEAVERRVAILGKLHGAPRLAGESVGRGEERRAGRWVERIREIKRDLRWRDWERYSNRQMGKVPMGGVVGEWIWEAGADWEGWPHLWLGQWLHAGKGTSMGLGRYRVDPL